MQEIVFANYLFKSVVIGSKFVTIRKGRRDYKLGKTIARSVEGEETTIYVYKIIYKVFGDLDLEDAYADGCKDVESLKELLKGFYQDLENNSIITIIYFSLQDSLVADGV